MQGSDLQFNVLTMVNNVLESVKDREFAPAPNTQHIGVKELAGICRGVTAAPSLALKPFEILGKSMGQKKLTQVTFPLLWLLARKDSPGTTVAAVAILGSRIRPRFDLRDELIAVKEDATSFVDTLLLKELRISSSDLLDIVQYEPLFRKMLLDKTIDSHAVQYADRTLKSIEGEKPRRETNFKKHAAGHELD